MVHILLGLLLTAAQAAFAANSTSFFDDPYLQYRPPFARSLPVQILLTGIVLTLVVVLFIHLVFTAQYHWPLAPVNYVLQISGVTTLLISLIATLHVVLSATIEESRKWPYMLSYIAVNVPPLEVDSPELKEENNEWSIAERATWLVMNASTSGLIQITHIQFLTLLYPSRLEARLIFFLLGPLAIVAAIMQLLPIHGDPKVNDVASAVRNVCNATLSLLFTAAVFIWGLLVNRRQAWRTDGGTAAFGAAALVLALVGTALNFLYVPREEEYVWLPGLMWAIILWQSFLGWWWWVGAGSGSASSGWDSNDEEEEARRQEKQEKRERRDNRRKAKTERRKERAKLAWRGVTDAFGRPRNHSGDEDEGSHSEIPRRRITSRRSRSPRNSLSSPPTSPISQSAPHSSNLSRGLSSASTASLSSDRTYATLPRGLPNIVHQWYASLRRAHVIAARQQAAEREQRIRELELERAANGRPPPRRHDGWGLGSFGWRLGRERSRPLQDPSTNVEVFESHGRRRRPQHPQSSDIDSMPSRRPPTSGPDDENPDNEPNSPPPRSGQPANSTNVTSRAESSPRSIWYWGPLGRWRLQDSTTY
ncbi:hypothetical protein HGRIS_002000 [Hohenbuehelia grisea]|uniref:Uncharacterized protein n=1 Tax=Hohenbuehelia grisea TaxID=104357 RepID=A0ABR3JJ86_9AGAR